MKTKALIAALLALFASVPCMSEEVSSDIFPYENRHSSFTVYVDVSKFLRFSVQTVYSTPTVSNVPFEGANIDVTNNTIYAENHNLATALPVLVASAPATGFSPITTGTTYYAIKITDNLLKLATTYAQAIIGENIDLLVASTGTWTLKPVALNLGTAGYLWYGSNDATNWIQVASVGSTVAASTKALTAMSEGSRLLDWGEFPYKYLRFQFNGPISGLIKLRAYLFGKQDR